MGDPVKRLFRIESRYTTSGLKVYIHSFRVQRETPNGYWINDIIRRKWVSKSGRRRYAWQSIEEATTSFKARKQQQVRILQRHLSLASEALTMDPSEYVDCTTPVDSESLVESS
jgi:hypothetical protein